MHIIPQPVHLTPRQGEFLLNQDVVVSAALPAQPAVQELVKLLTPLLGGAPRVKEPTEGERAVRLDFDASLPREGYRLQILPDSIMLNAGSPAGVFYAVQTMQQMLPSTFFHGAALPGCKPYTLPCAEIVDSPRFGWRGAMLDACRHFLPLDFVKKFIDLLALHKMNTFHWHLTEDQGWRIEIKKYPRLTGVGAWRSETLVGKLKRDDPSPQYDGVVHGGFYSQDEIRQVVAYAAERHINIVPEIEMPGHAQAAIAAYPELGNRSMPIGVSTHWGIHEDVFNVEEGTIRFLQNVLDEVMDLFPSPFIHVGGDECPKKQWRESPRAQARMQALGLKDEDELQSYFVRRMDAFLTARGRRLIGWDEILEGGLAQNATVMSWRGEKGGIEAALAGHDVVMAPNTYTYLDYYQDEDKEREPLAIGGYLPLERVYNYDPIPASLDPAQAHHVLGTQAQLWSEYIPNPQQVEYMAFPRLCALAEVAWTPLEGKNWEDFNTRLRSHLLRLDGLGVNYRRL
jgi:hexosaminidase